MTLDGHGHFIDSAGFSPDGKRIVTGSRDRTMKIWDAATGELLQTVKGHADELTSVAFSPDGRRLLTSSLDRTAEGVERLDHR